GDLDLAFQAECIDRDIDLVEEVVVVVEVGQHLRVDQQGGIDHGGIGVVQPDQFGGQFFQQGVRGGRLTEHVADLVLDLYRLGERAEVQADHRALQPAAGCGDRVFGN